MLLSLVDVKHHLRVDTNDDDARITAYAQAAERVAADFLNRSIYASEQAMTDSGDSDGVIINAAIEAAILLIIGRFYAQREDILDRAGALPASEARDLLWPYRIGLGV